AIPALVRVALERPLLHARPRVAGPGAEEAHARIDPRVREHHVQPPVLLGGLVDHAVELGVIGHVRRGAAHVEPLAPQATGLPGYTVHIQVDQRDPRTPPRSVLRPPPPPGPRPPARAPPRPPAPAAPRHAVSGDVEAHHGGGTLSAARVKRSDRAAREWVLHRRVHLGRGRTRLQVR